MASTEEIVSATKDNLHIIFGSRSHEERMKHLARLWHSDALFIDPFEWCNTHEQVSAAAAKVQKEGFVFSEIGPVDVSRPQGSEVIVSRLSWGFGKPGEKPEVTGQDVISFRDGKIERLYTFLDST